MNRCRISVGVLAALVALCMLSLFVTHRQCNEMQDGIRAVEAALEQEDTAAALEAYDSLSAQWEQFHNLTELFISGDKLAPIYERLAGLRPMIAMQHPDAPSQLAAMQLLVEELLEEELPVIWHIL